MLRREGAKGIFEAQLIRLRRDGAGGYFFRISENSCHSPRDALLKKGPRSLATQLMVGAGLEAHNEYSVLYVAYRNIGAFLGFLVRRPGLPDI
jgi:hypothetical protein